MVELVLSHHLLVHHLLHVSVVICLVQIFDSSLEYSLQTGSTLFVLGVAAMGTTHLLIELREWTDG